MLAFNVFAMATAPPRTGTLPLWLIFCMLDAHKYTLDPHLREKTGGGDYICLTGAPCGNVT